MKNTKVDRFSIESCGGMRIQTHSKCNISVVDNQVGLYGPKFSYIAEGTLYSTSFTEIDGHNVVMLFVYRRVGKPSNNRFVKERWNVYF